MTVIRPARQDLDAADVFGAPECDRLVVELERGYAPSAVTELRERIERGADVDIRATPAAAYFARLLEAELASAALGTSS